MTTTTAMVCVVLMLAAGVIWRLVFGRQLQTKPAPDTIAGEFYEQYREGYRETVCVELYDQIDRAVIRSLLHSQGIPTAEWYNHFAGMWIGVPVMGYNTVALLVLRDDLDDALDLMTEYWHRRYAGIETDTGVKVRALVEMVIARWIVAPSDNPAPPRLRVLERIR